MEDGNAKSGVFRFKGRCTKIQIRAFTTAVDTDFIFQGKHVSCDADQLVSMFLFGSESTRVRLQFCQIEGQVLGSQNASGSGLLKPPHIHGGGVGRGVSQGRNAHSQQLRIQNP